ncbi:MAG: family 78 glycoside hydrolase catalytic domain, partial [Clostridia bacterium]|nr:family 78 glycoside hydrolase catalytic domain [Clostridia bacterium]
MLEVEEVFGAAQWVCAGAYAKKTATIEDANGVPHFPILRNSFVLKGTIRRAVIRVLGLGFYHCYLNGQEISEDQFLPLSTDFEARDNYPTGETVTGHRIYVPEYDVTALLKDGKNTLALYFGGGWYTFDDARFGAPKAIYRLTVETEDGVKEFISSTDDKIGAGYVRTYHMTRFEAQDYQGFDDAALTNDFDDSTWKNALPAAPLSTDYQFCDCPADRVEKVLTPVLVKEDGNARSYDCGQNFSGYPVLKIKAKAGETVTVQFAEEKHEDGTPDMNFNYGQQFTVVSDGKERIVHPMFTWFAFRYFTVTGDAEVVEADFIHTAAALTSEFDCDNETLNWMFRAYINTQHCNMHAGIPSDCPHIERRGYTGDGQLTCHAVMDTMDARAFYHKWIADIGDCQDLATGHVQYTAPYTRCGGGPGGWGCAIVEVPYTYYKHYGDKEPMQRLYPQMKRY